MNERKLSEQVFVNIRENENENSVFVTFSKKLSLQYTARMEKQGWTQLLKIAVLRIRNDLFWIRIQLQICRVPDPDQPYINKHPVFGNY